MFTVNIDTDNAAFEDDPATEIARILRRIAERVEAGEGFRFFETILDANGNDVGRFALKSVDFA